MAKGTSDSKGDPSKLIDERIRELGDWRGETLARVRALVKQVDPDVVETWKWRGVPVWEHDGRSTKRRGRRSFTPPWN